MYIYIYRYNMLWPTRGGGAARRGAPWGGLPAEGPRGGGAPAEGLGGEGGGSQNRFPYK